MSWQAQGPIVPHTIVTLPNTNGNQLLLCYDNEGVYVNTNGKVRRLSCRGGCIVFALFARVLHERELHYISFVEGGGVGHSCKYYSVGPLCGQREIMMTMGCTLLEY